MKYEGKKIKVAVTTTSFGQYDLRPLELLKNAGVNVFTNSSGRKMTEKEIVSLCSDCIGIIAGTESYTREILVKLDNLKIISRCGVGIDSIDLDTAKDLKIKVMNTPYGPTQSVAELTLAMMLNLLRCVSTMDCELKHGIWLKRMGNLLQGKKVGIIGYGRIGRKVAELLVPFGVEIAYTDTQIKEKVDMHRLIGLDELLTWADIITVHCSVHAGAGPILGKEELMKLRKGCWIINTSRGGVIDEEALYGLLSNKHLSGAALDVFKQEPYKGPLSNLENVLMTPHIGSYARESRIQMEIQAVENLLAGLGIR